MRRGPSAWIVAGLAAAAGATIGGATAVSELVLQPLQVGEMGIVTAPTSGAAPKLVTPEVTHDFGRMVAGGTGYHEFPFTNAGNAELQLVKGATSCKCTISGLEQTSIAPGETANVRLEWTTTATPGGGDFRQTALIITNDPMRPEVTLSIQGRAFVLWDLMPSSLVFSDIQPDSVTSASTRILTYGSQAPELKSVRISQATSSGADIDHSDDDPNSADHEANSQYFTAIAEPLDDASLAGYSDATGGLLVTVTTVPPLPPNQISNQLEVVLTFPGQEMPDDGGIVSPGLQEPEGGWRVTLPVTAKVAGPLSLAGGQWDATRDVLRIGTLSSATGGQTKLFLTAKGEHRNAVRPIVKEVVPESMQVEVGEPSAVGDGVVVRIPLAISIPAGSPTCNHLGSQQGKLGRIVLETGHPDVPELTIPVRVAVSP